MTDTASDNFVDDLSFDSEPISPFDPQDNSGKRALILLGLTFGGLLLLAILVFNLYQPGTRDRGTPPIITADNQPFKVEPSDAGGSDAPDQDREVFNQIDGTGEVGIETTPDAEDPVNLADELPDTVEVELQPVVPVRPAQTRPDPTPSRPEPTPAASTPEPVRVAETPRPTTSSVAGGSSDWVVQVASLRSESEAQATWNSLSGQFSGSLPSSAIADIQRADLAEKGIYYRLRVAGLADKSAANALCNTFKAQGQACFLAKR